MSQLIGNYTFIVLYIQRKGRKFCLQKQEFTKGKKHEIIGGAELSSKSDSQSIFLFSKKVIFLSGNPEPLPPGPSL